jgi:hypothetical protein
MVMCKCELWKVWWMKSFEIEDIELTEDVERKVGCRGKESLRRRCLRDIYAPASSIVRADNSSFYNSGKSYCPSRFNSSRVCAGERERGVPLVKEDMIGYV